MGFSHVQDALAIYAVVDHQQLFSLGQGRRHHRLDCQSARATQHHRRIATRGKGLQQLGADGDEQGRELLLTVAQVSAQQGLLHAGRDVHRTRIEQDVWAHKKWRMAYSLWQELYAHLAGCDCPTGVGSIERPEGASHTPISQDATTRLDWAV